MDRRLVTVSKGRCPAWQPVILQVDAGKMHGAGFRFFLSANGVWLTDSVPALFLTKT